MNTFSLVLFKISYRSPIPSLFKLFIYLFLPEWSADISGDHCCSLGACFTPGETHLPLLAKKWKSPLGNVQGKGLRFMPAFKRCEKHHQIFFLGVNFQTHLVCPFDFRDMSVCDAAVMKISAWWGLMTWRRAAVTVICLLVRITIQRRSVLQTAWYLFISYLLISKHFYQLLHSFIFFIQ